MSQQVWGRGGNDNPPDPTTWVCGPAAPHTEPQSRHVSVPLKVEGPEPTADILRITRLLYATHKSFWKCFNHEFNAL